MSSLREARIVIPMHGEGSDTDDLWRPERRSSDWIIGDAPPQETETTELDLAPFIERSATLSLWGRPSPRG